MIRSFLSRYCTSLLSSLSLLSLFFFSLALILSFLSLRSSHWVLPSTSPLQLKRNWLSSTPKIVKEDETDFVKHLKARIKV